MRSSWRAGWVGLWIILAAAAGPLEAQVQLLNVNDGSKGEGSDGQAPVDSATPRRHGRSRSRPSTASTRPTDTIDAALPSLQYTWSRTTSCLAHGKYFDVVLDTPSMSNFEYRYKGNGQEWVEGACFGMTSLAVLWLKKIVVPILDQSFLRYVFSDDGMSMTDVAVANTLSIPGPIRKGNLGDYRLRSYSDGNKQQVALAAVKLMTFQGAGDMRAKTYASPKEFLDEVVDEVSDKDDEVALLDLYTQIGEGAHSLMIYRVEQGFAKPVGGGDEVAAIRFLMFDPNLPDLYPRRVTVGQTPDSPLKSPYLMYFPDAQKVAFPPDYLKNYESSQSPTGIDRTAGGVDHTNYFQDGTYYTGTLRLHPIHDSHMMSSTSAMRVKIGDFEMSQDVKDVTPDQVDLKLGQ